MHDNKKEDELQEEENKNDIREEDNNTFHYKMLALKWNTNICLDILDKHGKMEASHEPESEHGVGLYWLGY